MKRILLLWLLVVSLCESSFAVRRLEKGNAQEKEAAE
jgi:hypothetical protein